MDLSRGLGDVYKRQFPSHAATFLTLNPDFGKSVTRALPDITFVRKELRFSLLKEAVIVANTDLFGLTAMTAGYPNPKFRDLSKLS
jgi:hypothetical protein